MDKLYYSVHTSNDLKIVKEYLESGGNINLDNGYLLRLSSANGFYQIVKFLIENGADINIQDGYALRYAACHDFMNIVKYLIEKGANVSYISEELLQIIKRKNQNVMYDYLHDLVWLNCFHVEL